MTSYVGKPIERAIREDKALIWRVVNKQYYKLTRMNPHPLPFDKEDLFQEACLFLLAKAPQYDATKGAFSTWLATYANYGIQNYARECLDFRATQFQATRRNISTAISLQTPIGDTLVLGDVLAEREPLAVDDGRAAETLDTLERRLDAFRPRLAQILRLRRRGLTTAQVAESLGVSVKRIYQQLEDITEFALRMMGR